MTMRRLLTASRVIVAAGASWLVLALQPAGAQDQVPRFRSSVEVTSVDVTVVDNRGRPVTDLTAADFTVRIDGKPRPVLSAEWVSLVTEPGSAPDPRPIPEGYSSNESATGGRLILLVIDQPNIRFGAAASIRRAVEAFVDRLEPSDRVAVIGIGPGSPRTPFTADRDRIMEAVNRLPGGRQRMVEQHNIGLTEAIEMVRRGSGMVREQVIGRECEGILDPVQLQVCVLSVESEALTIALQAEHDADMTFTELRSLLVGLRAIDAPKTLMLVSSGFITGDQQASMDELGSLAALARTSIYALHLEEMFTDISRALPSPSASQDRWANSEGLSALTAAARGTLFNISVNADAAFDRIESELSGYYLLGLESDPSFKDGRVHPVSVQVGRRGLSVRTRRRLIVGADDVRSQSTREAVMTGLTSPLVLSALPLRVATFSLRAAEPGKVQLLMHADVGSGYTQTRPVSLAYMFLDPGGRIVESQTIEARLPPVMAGVPSALQFTGGASLPPGEYTLKLSVGEGDLVGTIEHPVRAQLLDGGVSALSELIVGGPLDRPTQLRPTVGHTVSFGILQGYLEAYGDGVDDLRARYEIASDSTAPPILSAQVEGRQAGPDRRIFSEVLPVRQLPPGSYFLRAVLTSASGDGAAPLKTVARSFEVAAPAVLMTSADSTVAAPVASAEVFLPVEELMFERAFKLEEATSSDLLQIFRARVAEDARSAFDQGVALLADANYPQAESSFKNAIRLESDSTSALTYLAAVYAASGHDIEAAGAWQTALIEGSDLPQIYVWLGDALLRMHEFAQARAILEEAVAKWPADARFAKPLALIYATFGLGQEAVRMLVRHLDAASDDLDTMYMAIEWIYNLHVSGAVARSRADDVRLAKSYAEGYAKAGGLQTELVKQWMDALEGRRR
jgi:VWFA-related protein